MNTEKTSREDGASRAFPRGLQEGKPLGVLGVTLVEPVEEATHDEKPKDS